MRTVSKICLPLLLMTLGCIDQLEIEVPFDEPRLVVDGLISSQEGLSFIKIGWSYPTGSHCTLGPDNNYPFPCPEDTSTGPYKVTGMVRVTRGENDIYEYPVQMADRKNYITITPDIVGIPGEQFSLDVDIRFNNETMSYHAETVMLPTPEIVDIGYEIRKGDVGKEDSFVPLLYFNEPQDQKNFYLFYLCETQADASVTYCGHSRVWSYSVIRDDFLPAFVNGLSIDDGATVARYADFYPPVQPGIGAKVTMYSVPVETYEFYKALLDQFNNDGGAFRPTPATPPGNINGGALGLFRALHPSTGVVFHD